MVFWKKVKITSETVKNINKKIPFTVCMEYAHPMKNNVINMYS